MTLKAKLDGNWRGLVFFIVGNGSFSGRARRLQKIPGIFYGRAGRKKCQVFFVVAKGIFYSQEYFFWSEMVFFLVTEAIGG